MNEWTVVTVIVTLVGLSLAIVKPLLSLNSIITRLNESVRALEEKISDLSDKNSESHRRMWEKMRTQEATSSRQNLRLALAENRKPENLHSPVSID